jgi:diguanylate cyclase (GGDEF)-like protein/PAS domain S-box-containing protein
LIGLQSYHIICDLGHNEKSMSVVKPISSDQGALQTILDLCTSNYVTDGTVIFVLAGSLMQRVIASGLGLKIAASFELGIDVPGRVWASGEPLLVQQYPHWSERTIEEAVSVVAAVPIMLGGTVAGVLMLMYRQAVQLSAGQVGQLERMAGLAASTLENGFLRQQSTKQIHARAADKVTLSAFDQKLQLFESAIVNADESVSISQVLVPDDGDEQNSSIIFVNTAFSQLMGFSLQQSVGQSAGLLRGIHADTDDYQRIRAELRSGKTVELETIEYRKDNTPLWVQLSIVPIRNERGQIANRVSWRRNITERKSNELLEAYRNRVLELALSGAPLNETLQTLTGLLEKVFVGATAGVFMHRAGRLALLAAPNWRPLVRSLLDGVPVGLGHGTAAYAILESVPAVVESIQDDPRWNSMDRAMLMSGVTSSWAVPIPSADGAVIGALELHFSQRITPSPAQLEHFENVARLTTLVIERSTLIERLDVQASTDTLTNLPNRYGVERHLEQAIGVAQQRGWKLAVLQIDLDGFRRINDTLGHEVGDEVLRNVTERWRTILPSSDMLARPGGDEFTLVVQHLEHLSETEALAKEILKALSYPLWVRGVELFLSASIGTAVFPDDGTTAAILLRNADTAMNMVKRGGKSNSKRFEPSMNSQAKERLNTEVALRRALERNEFVVRYQPQVNALQQVTVVEALLYWQHPKDGLVAPGRFLPVALESGLIVPMGEWILRKACEEVGAWRRDGLNVALAVNIDVQQLIRADFSETVARILRETNFDPNALELEVTESALMNDTDLAAERLQSLQAQGIQTAIDDFGTGYSSLAYLQKLPVHSLKIDRSFISHLEPNDSGWSLVKLIVMLARHMGKSVVAEGVETRAQFLALRELAVDRSQGYYFSKPVAAADLLGRLKAP